MPRVKFTDEHVLPWSLQPRPDNWEPLSPDLQARYDTLKDQADYLGLTLHRIDGVWLGHDEFYPSENEFVLFDTQTHIRMFKTNDSLYGGVELDVVENFLNIVTRFDIEEHLAQFGGHACDNQKWSYGACDKCIAAHN